MGVRLPSSHANGSAADWRWRTQILEWVPSMKEARPTSSPPNSNSSAPHTISVIYEDRVAGLRGKYFADQLTSALAHEHECSITMWRCELVELLADHIAGETAQAEYVILSLRGNAGLSGSMKHFVESWLQTRKSEAPILIALFDPARGKVHINGSICSYLEHVASAAGIHFFSRETLTTIAADPLASPSAVAKPAGPKWNRENRNQRATTLFSETAAA